MAIQNLATRLNGRSRQSSTTTEPQRMSNMSTSSASAPIRRTELGILQSQYGRPVVHNPNQPIGSNTGERRTTSTHIGPRFTTPNPSFLHPQVSHSVPHVQPSIVNDPTNLDPFNFQDHASLPSAYLAGSGTFLGIAQQFSDNPIPDDEIMNLFNNEDLPPWLGADSGFRGI